jgi:hypothetical protein
MPRSARSSRAFASGALVVASVLALAIAVPAVGQDPTGSPAPVATKAPARSPNPGQLKQQERAAKGARIPQVPVTLTGKVGTRTDTDGALVYTLTVGGTTYDLHAGPPWWWGDGDPLKGLVGSTVTITGERAEGSTTVDVFTAGGKTLREPGRPPWAGGWKAVGERHPGWAQWKADKAAEKTQGKAIGRPSWAGPKTPEDDGD